MSRRPKLSVDLSLLATCALLLLPVTVFGLPDQTGEWGPVLDWGIQGKHTAVLPTGNLLVWSTGDNARVWDPDAGTFTDAPALFGDLHCAGEAALADGRTIVIGGVNGPPHVGINVTSLFDPFTSTWTQGTPMQFERWYPSVTILPDGRVLAASGDDSTGTRVLVPEIYDPIADTWTQLSGASRGQSLYPFMYVLPGGKIYEAGAGSSTWFLDTNGTGSWSPGPINAYGTTGYSESSAMYAPGKIIRSGGGDPAIAQTSIIDMTAVSPQWEQVTPMAFPRRRHNLVLLPDGQILAVGGTRAADDATQAVLDSEIWNPQTKTWTTVAAMAEPRMYHSSAALLPDGRVISAGGEAAGRLRAQIYSPPYLFKGARPTIAAAPATAAYGSTFFIDTSDAASIANVVLLRTSAATHAWDQNQRYVPLSFSLSGGRLSVTAPADGSVAPPGYYLLFIVNGNGVPSIAEFVQLATSGNLAPGEVQGTVTDSATNQAIAGAMVSYGGGTTSTDADGNYTLTNVAPGERTITAFKTSYAPAEKTVVVIAGQTVTVDIALAPPGSVSGRVTDSSTGAGIGGATVTYDGGSTVTDADGSYSIAEIAAGTQILTASATNYTHLQKSTVVPANGSATADFALTIASTFITGQVIDSATLVPIVGATVGLSDGTKTTTSDANGVYRISDTPPATYDVAASASGHISETHVVVVTTGAYATSDFALSPVVGGTRIKEITFEDASLTNAITGADSVQGQVTLDSATPIHGSYSARAAATNTYLQELFAATDDLYVSAYLRLNAAPSSDTRILMFTNAGTTVGNIQVRSTRRLRLRVGSTVIGAETPALALADTYRIGLHQRRGSGGDGILEAFLSAGEAPFGAPFARIATGTWTTAADRIKFGVTSGAANLTLDDIVLDAAVMPSPSASPPPPTPPTADFVALSTSGNAPFNVNFQDKTTGSLTSWSWDFGDGGSSTERNPSHTYTSPGTYTVSLTVQNAAGSDTETKLGYITVGAALPTQTFTPVADAHVNSASASRNYGTVTTLRVRSSSAGSYNSYLKFTVANVTGAVTNAKLRLFVTDASPDGGSLYSVNNNWTESGITWSGALTDAPISGSPLKSVGAVAVGAWVDLDVTSVVTGNGTYSFALKSNSSNSAYYSSREGTGTPQLVLTLN